MPTAGKQYNNQAQRWRRAYGCAGDLHHSLHTVLVDGDSQIHKDITLLLWLSLCSVCLVLGDQCVQQTSSIGLQCPPLNLNLGTPFVSLSSVVPHLTSWLSCPEAESGGCFVKHGFRRFCERPWMAFGMDSSWMVSYAPLTPWINHLHHEIHVIQKTV